jgi:hypothetical protein
MKKAYGIALFILLTAYCSAQQTNNPANARLLARFPFKQYSGGVMVIKAKLENVKDSFNFILDTGCGGISLDSATCAENNIFSRQSDTTITGMGSSLKVHFVFNQQLHFPGLTVDRLNFHINNYEILTSVYGEKIDGIIGYSFFSRFIVKINFDNSVIEVYTPGKIKYNGPGLLLHPVFNKTIPVQQLTIKDRKKINFPYYFDTGAGLNFLMSESFAKDSGILADDKKIFDMQAEGIGGKIKMRLTVVKCIRLGKYKFRNVPSCIYNDSFNVTSYPLTGGLLGNDLLRRFNLTINYPQKEIYLMPGKQFFSPFDYAYTGIAIYFVDGNILIDDIIENSPGAIAGIKKDDILISVGNDCSNNIIQYKTLLQSAKEKIKIIVKRNNELLQLTIKPISIL